MQDIEINPFTITKAVDLSDEDILKLWVNLPEDESKNLVRFIKPTSLMPMFIIGGKGSGKTHLLRYLSFQVRQIKHKESLLEGIKNDGFLGLYLRCSGMNASRFCGKGISDEVWHSIFAYYFELWTAKNSLSAILTISKSFKNSKLEKEFCKKFVSLFDVPPRSDITSLNDANLYIENLLKSLDYAVNNCIYEKNIFPSILCTSGSLIYNIPTIFNEVFLIDKIIFQYIFDEFENFEKIHQQIYINTLLRERRGDCSIKIGSRLIGIKTHKTLCADEENKQGSEFELINLDDYYRGSGKQFSEFAIRLINTRLEPLGLSVFKNQAESGHMKTLRFESYKKNPFDDHILAKVFEKRLEEREYFKQFKKNIKSKLNEKDVVATINLLEKAHHPLLQKALTYYVYIQISKKENIDFFILEQDVTASLEKQSPVGLLGGYIQHYKSDFIAQLCREFRIQIPYAYEGINSLIDISMANPRHLLILFKYIYDWAAYRDEVDLSNITISIEAQESGIAKAAEWFYHDAKLIGIDGDHVQASIERLCDLFRQYRYSDKPAECSVCIFSANISNLSMRARETLDIAKKWLLIIDVGTHNTKNLGSKIHKYQINKLLSPRWELAVARRGTIQLTSEELNAIFDEKYVTDLPRIARSRIQRMTFPFVSKQVVDNQGTLLGD